MTRFIAILVVAVASCSQAQVGDRGSAHPENGTYTLCRQAFVFQNEVLELKGGHFRYWVWSDVGPRTIVTEGKYTVDSDVLVLDTTAEIPKVRYRRVCQGYDALLRDDARAIWDDKGELYSYGALLRVSYPAEELWRNSADLAGFTNVFWRLPPCAAETKGKASTIDF